MAVVDSERLKLLIERIERLEEEKRGIADDIKDIYAEAKAVGYDPKTIRKIVAIRKMDVSDYREQEDLLATYKAALGMDDVPTALEVATDEREKVSANG